MSDYSEIVHISEYDGGNGARLQFAPGRSLADLTPELLGAYYCTPSRHQGRTVEVSYSGGTTIAELGVQAVEVSYSGGTTIAEYRYMRVIDHSTGERWYYELAEMPAGEGL